MRFPSLEIFQRSPFAPMQYYDIRKKCEGELCYDFSSMEELLNDGPVRKALGVGDIEFVSCSTSVYTMMENDWMKNLEVGIPALLEDGIRVLIYVGEYDLICNWLGKTQLDAVPIRALYMYCQTSIGYHRAESSDIL